MLWCPENFLKERRQQLRIALVCPGTETSSWTWWVAKATLHSITQAICLSFQIAKDRSVRWLINKHCLASPPPSRILHLHSQLLMDDKIAILGDFNLESTALKATHSCSCALLHWKMGHVVQVTLFLATHQLRYLEKIIWGIVDRNFLLLHFYRRDII